MCRIATEEEAKIQYDDNSEETHCETHCSNDLYCRVTLEHNSLHVHYIKLIQQQRSQHPKMIFIDTCVIF